MHPIQIIGGGKSFWPNINKELSTTYGPGIGKLVATTSKENEVKSADAVLLGQGTNDESKGRRSAVRGASLKPD